MESVKMSFIYIFLLISSITSVSIAQSKATVGAMMLFGTGNMGNTTDVVSRAMTYTPIALFGGYNFNKFRLGLNYEYNLAGQTADPASVGNQNVGGKGSVMGIRFDYYDGAQSIGLVYHLSEKYTLDKPTILGTPSAYDGKMGYGFQYYRQFRNKVGIVFDYTTSDMKSATANSNDINWSRISLGLVFTNFSK